MASTKVKLKEEEATEVAAAEAVTDIDQLPRQAFYNKALFYKVYYPDLAVDILLFVFSVFVSDTFFSPEGLFNSLKQWQTVAMYCVVILTLPYYLGYLYVKSSVFYSKPVMKLFQWLFIIMVAMVLVNLVRLMTKLDLTDFQPSDVNGFMGIFSLFMIVLGPMMCIGGASAARSEMIDPGAEKRDKFNSEKFVTIGALFMIVMGIGFMIYFMGLLPKEAGWSVIVAFFAGPIAAVIVYGLFIAFLTLLDKIGVYKYLAFVAKNTFPAFIISVLVFWAGVAIYFMKNDFGGADGKLSAGGVIFSVCLSGLVPFRLVLMFNPPWRIVNIISGIISLTWFLCTLLTLIA